MGFGEVCVKKPSCGCFSLKGSSQSREGALRIRIAANEEQLQTYTQSDWGIASPQRLASSESFCQLWIEDKAVHRGRGQLKFTFCFHARLHTTALSIRILKLVSTHDRRLSSKDSIDCRIYVSQRDFRTLQEINNSFLSKVEKLLLDVQQHQAFASKTDLIKQKLENYALAIFPDSEGFVLFKEHDEAARPEHVLLRIRPTTLELCLPQYRSLLPTFGSERHPVTSLQEALMEFTRLQNWPLVRRGQFGVDWTRDRQKSQPRFETARIEHQWEVDDSQSRDIDVHFLDDTVQNFHTNIKPQEDKSAMDTTQWKVDSVRSLVREAACISLHENGSVYFAIEKATLSILSHSDAVAVAFVESIASVIRTQGSESIGVYKLLAATVDLQAVKKAVIQQDVLSTLQEQYELMTQMIARSTTSDSSESRCSLQEAHMEVNKMHCFTVPRIAESEASQTPKRRLSVSEVSRTENGGWQSSRCQVVQTGSAGTTLSTLSVDLDVHPKQNSISSRPATADDFQEQEQRQDVPKLTFYWLTHHDGVRSSNSGTTHTSISLPDGRSIVFDEDLRANGAMQNLPRARSVTEHTLRAWGVKLDAEVMEDSEVSVAYTIKCTILEIMCAFSSLNLEAEICEDCGETRDFRLLNNTSVDEELHHPSAMAVLELLAPRWQVFPGEQPPIRWGPTERGTHVALALMHEFACSPLNEVESPNKALLNMRLFMPQDHNTESYLALLAGAKNRLTQVLQFPRIDSNSLEEMTAVIHMLGDFVASSPSFAPAQLVAYSCMNTFLRLEEYIFKAYEPGHWPIPVFTLFHALLRLFRCMLERATDDFLEEFLITSLLKRDSWVKLAREYSQAVLFSEKLEKTCEPEELNSLRSAVWSYHTALVNVVRAQRDGAVQDHENLPQDFQDARPASFGQDPLDFLRYLISPGDGYAPRVLRRRDWEPTPGDSSPEGGLHAQVLVFLRALFSIPNNVFVKQRDISTHYLELHWNGFRRSYLQAATGRSYASTVVCRRHLEVIRVLMGHHHVEIFVQVIKLGIMDCLADEIALEAANSSNFGTFDPPPSRLKKPSDENALFSEASTTDADSGLLSSFDFGSSEGLTTHATQSLITSSKGSQDSCWTNLLKQNLDYSREVPSMTHLETGVELSSPCTTSSSSKGKKTAHAPRLGSLRERKLRSEEIPSRIPIFKHRRSPNGQKDAWRSSVLFSFQKRSESKGSRGSISAFSPFETRIPCPPFHSMSIVESEQGNRGRAARGVGTSQGGFSSLFSRRSSDSLRLQSGVERGGRRPRSQLTSQARNVGERLVNKLRTKSVVKGTLPGLSPSAQLTPLVKATQAKRSNSTHKQSLHSSPVTVVGRQPQGGMRATISYSPSGLHVRRLSVDRAPSPREMSRTWSLGKSTTTRTATNVPLLNLTRLNSQMKKPGMGHNQLHISNVSLSSRTKNKMKRTVSNKLDNEINEPRGLLSHPFSVECDTCPTPSLNAPESSDRQYHSRANQSFDESCDSHGPPTFSIYCGARVDRRSDMGCAGVGGSNEVNGEQSVQGVESPTANSTSPGESSLPRRFQTPSDFECTGDFEEDCKRLESYDRESRGLQVEAELFSSDSDLDGEFETPAPQRPVFVPLLKMGTQYEPNDYSRNAPVPSLLLQTQKQDSVQEDEETRQLTTGAVHRGLSRHTSPSARQITSQETPSSSWIRRRTPSALSGFRTPSDFEYTGDVDEDVKKLERLERMYYGESSPAASTSDSDELDSMVEEEQFCRSPVFEPRPVPKLNFLAATDRAPSGGLRHPGPSNAKVSIETEEPSGGVQSQGDELSSFSWMHLSTKESVSESEFSALLQGTAPAPPSDGVATLSPYEAAKEERHVYSDVHLRSIWAELLLEGMLLEYNTRPARDHDTHTLQIERIIKFVPKVLVHHLDHASSKPVVSLLKKKLVFQSPNVHRLLRLLTSSLFPAELYIKKDHIARGAFAHVFRCPLPLEGGPETCAVKVLDHPVEHNEMSTLMDTYSEISIMEQFKEEPSISHIYDYGVSSGSVFVVMKDYRCSLLEWRKRFPEQSPGALRLFLRIFRNIIDAVKVLHDRNVVHFDLKCSNILLEPLPGISEDHFWNPPTEEPPFRVVLADFGEARSYSNNWEARTVRNHGTEFNKSPEMLLIAKAQQTECPEYDRRKRIGAGPPSDVWALGCLLFELVTSKFLQFDNDWFRFFLRVTTNTMSIVDGEKQKLLGYDGQGVIAGLLEFILVRPHLCRPNLTSLGQKLDADMASNELPPFSLPTSIEAIPISSLEKVPRSSAMSLLGTAGLPWEEVVSFSPFLKMARKECLLSPWTLSQNKISLIVYIKGTRPAQTNLHSTAARANVELLEIALGDEESVSPSHAEVVLSSVSHSRCICFTCEEGFESDTYELILKTLHKQYPSTTIFEHLTEIQRSLKTF